MKTTPHDHAIILPTTKQACQPVGTEWGLTPRGRRIPADHDTARDEDETGGEMPQQRLADPTLVWLVAERKSMATKRVRVL